jgi:polyhydroxyalkanoate synthesis regulator phasin
MEVSSFREEDLNFLRDEMASLKEKIETVESRIKQLQTEKEK